MFVKDWHDANAEAPISVTEFGMNIEIIEVSSKEDALIDRRKFDNETFASV
jgi:hypothetical protein